MMMEASLAASISVSTSSLSPSSLLRTCKCLMLQAVVVFPVLLYFPVMGSSPALGSGMFSAVQEGVITMIPRNLEAGREGVAGRDCRRGRRNLFDLSAWFTGPLVPENKGERNEYITHPVTGNSCLPDKVVLVMPVALQGVRSRACGSHQFYPDISTRQIPVLITDVSNNGDFGFFM